MHTQRPSSGPPRPTDDPLFGAEPHLDCPACGEDNAVSARFCARCGALLCLDIERALGGCTGEPTYAGALFDERYRVFEEIGRGGMGVVYRARDEELGRTVALKVLPEQFDVEPEIVRRFQREARAMAALDHPNVVPVYGTGRVGRLHYFAMKWLPGRAISTELDRHRRDGTRMAPGEAARVAAAVCHGLHHAHLRGLVHRDVKPGNIMLGLHGQVTLMDFGIVKERFGAQLTDQGRVFGTPEYMAPEQAQGIAPPSPTTDIYSVGVLLFEMLTGSLPFTGETPYAVVVSHINDPTPDLHQRVPGLDPDLVSVVARALSKQPRQRFASAREMARALERLADTDRRDTRRVPINRAFESLDNFALEYAADISMAGCFIRTESPLEPGTRVLLHFTILDHDFALIEGEGVVSRVIDRPGQRGMGVQFLELTERAAAHLADFLRNRDGL